MQFVVSSTSNLFSIINHLAFDSGKCYHISEIRDELCFTLMVYICVSAYI